MAFLLQVWWSIKTTSMLLIVIAVYLIITFILTVLGIEKQTEGLKIFLISLFFTPIVGLAYLYTKRNKASRVNYFYCHKCDYIYPVKMRDCPICAEEGEKVRLRRYHSPYDLTDKIGSLTIA